MRGKNKPLDGSDGTCLFDVQDAECLIFVSVEDFMLLRNARRLQFGW